MRRAGAGCDYFKKNGAGDYTCRLCCCGARYDAVTAELFGMKYIYFDSGLSAAQPIPAGMIRSIKKELTIPLIIGGGIRTAVDARRVRQAGADMVVTGTIIENAGYRERLRSILSALKD